MGAPSITRIMPHEVLRVVPAGTGRGGDKSMFDPVTGVKADDIDNAVTGVVPPVQTQPDQVGVQQAGATQDGTAAAGEQAVAPRVILSTQQETAIIAGSTGQQAAAEGALPQPQASTQQVIAPQVQAGGQQVIAPQLPAGGQQAIAPQVQASGQQVIAPQVQASGQQAIAPQVQAIGQQDTAKPQPQQQQPQQQQPQQQQPQQQQPQQQQQQQQHAAAQPEGGAHVAAGDDDEDDEDDVVTRVRALSFIQDLHLALSGRRRTCLGLSHLELHYLWPRLSSSMTEGAAAVAMSDLRLEMNMAHEPPVFKARYSLCGDHDTCTQAPGERLRYNRHRTCTPRCAAQKLGLFWVQLDAWGDPGMAAPPVEQQGCTYVFDGPVVMYSRHSPPDHLGHRMLTDMPAFWGLKQYLEQVVGISTSELTLVFADKYGDPPWATPNFKAMLEATGFKAFHTNRKVDAVWCAPQAVLVTAEWWLHEYIDEDNSIKYLWDRPDVLWDTDSTSMMMVEAVRQQVGLPGPLPFAPLHPQRIMIASRDPRLRQSAHLQRAGKRQFLNEGALVEALRGALGGLGVEVHQVEFSLLNLQDSLRVLENASMLIGYHGAALDLTFWLPRGAYLMEIFPMGADHPPLYPSKAAVTGKQFIEWVSDDRNSHICNRVRGCPGATHRELHDADLEMSPAQIAEVVDMVSTALKMQRWTLRRFPWHWRQPSWDKVPRAKDEVAAARLPPFPRNRAP